MLHKEQKQHMADEIIRVCHHLSSLGIPTVKIKLFYLYNVSHYFFVLK